MPLDEEEWRAASPTQSDADIVYGFLGERPTEAYNVQEIMGELFDLETESPAGQMARAVMFRYIRAILELLIADGKVEERVVTTEDDSGDETTVSYFRAVEPRD